MTEPASPPLSGVPPQTSMRWHLWHRTTYAYDDEVTDSLGIAYLTPRSTSWQRVGPHSVEITPPPGDVTTDTDHYGNTATYFQVTTPHEELVILARSEVEVDAQRVDDAVLGLPWEQVRPAERADVSKSWRALDFVLSSTHCGTPAGPHAGAVAYAARSLWPGRSVGESLVELIGRVKADFRYERGATTVTSTIDDVLEERAGVCQDFAHLAIAGLRGHGLAVRYVSGYLATEPPPGQDRIVGADASHAWIAVWLPDPSRPSGHRWWALDPTNDQVVGPSYVTAAWGRDYGDVPPVKGVIFTEASTSTLTVEVDVAPA